MNKNCRICGEKLTKIFDFGKQPLGNGFLDEKNFKDEYFFDMEVGYSQKSFMFQLINQPDPKKMFHENYAFFSSTSRHMKNHFKNFYQELIDSEYKIEKNNSFVVEIGCNDGILIKNFSDSGFKHLGIEPSLNVANVAKKNNINILNSFFNKNISEKIIKNFQKVDLFLAANVMCHIPTIVEVVSEIKKSLSEKGVVVFEEPYLGDVIEKNSYDQIYDEHVFLFSGHSIKYLFNIFDLELIDMKHQSTPGGSMRYYLANKNQYKIKESVNLFLNNEKKLNIDNLSGFDAFNNNVKKSKNDLITILNELKAEGKKVVGYAATSKSTSILNYCDIDKNLIEYICDTTPIKIDKFSPGMHIPIVSYQHFLDNPPDYAFLFAWNHQNEIFEKEHEYRKLGGKWITHVPEVKIF